MALVVKDRVRETSTTTGTGTFTLAGAVTGYQAFSAVGDGNTTYYTIYLQGGNEWEVGIGTYTASGTTLSRDTILASSNAGSAVNFSAGVKDVFVTYPAGRSVWYDSATNVTLNALTLSGGTQNGVLYLNASRVATSGSALTFDGTILNNTGAAPGIRTALTSGLSYTTMAYDGVYATGTDLYLFAPTGKFVSIYANNAEQMRLTSTGVVIRQSSNAANTSVSLNTTIQNALTLEADGDLLVGTTTNTNSSKLVASGTISETVSSTQYLVASQFDIGTAANEIPLNQYLGNLAYQDAGSIAGQVGLSAGTAALPSLVSATDTDTGMWFPAANTLAWSTGGTRAMTLHSSGGFSVGTATDPGIGNIGLTNGGKLQYSATAYISPEDNVAGARIVTPGVLNVATGGTAVRMTLDASGFLVVGDTTTGSSRFTSASTSYPETTEYAGVFKAGTVSPLSNRYLLLRQTYTGGAFDSLPLVWEANADGANQKSYGVIQTIADGSIVFSNKAAGAAVAIGTALGVAERARITSTGGFETRPAANGHAVFNEDGVDADFRVESDTQTHMLFVDAGDNSVNINTNTPLGGKLNVNGAIYGNENHKVHYPLPIFNFGAGGISDEYWVLARRYVGSSILASGLMGRIVGTRGSTTSGNLITYQNVIVQSAYLSNEVVGIDSQGSTPSFEAIDIISISGVEYYAARGRASGGPCDNGLWFEGMMVNNTGDTNVFSYTRASTPGVSVITTNVATLNTWVFRDTYLQAQRAGYDRQTINGTETNFNDAGLDYDFRVESDTGTHCLFVDASTDRVGIGTSTPEVKLDVFGGVSTTFTNLPANLRLVNNGTIAAGLGSGINFSANYDNSIQTTYAVISGIRENATSGSPAGVLVFGARSPAGGVDMERARITSGGYFKASNDGTYYGIGSAYHELRQTSATASDATLVVTATNASLTGDIVYARSSRAANTAFRFYVADANGTEQFYVRGDGAIYAQNTTVQSISDARLKENVRDASEGLNVIAALRPVRYDWKSGYGNDRKDQLGFIAQEVESVFPDAVSEWKGKEGDEIYKTVGPGALIPVLVKAIQEQQAMINELKAEVAALKGA